MKKIIINLLKNGYTTTKKYTYNDLIKHFFILEYIIKDDNGWIGCKNNKFWHHTNNEKRIALINDLEQSRLGDMKTSYFSIINRFENGDHYGIERN